LEEADAVDDAMVFHAGTRAEGNQIHTSGGRVLCVTALGADKEEARLRAYEAYDLLEWDGKFCRRDIGSRVEARAALQAAAEIKMELLRERD
jgi:phosphoribosylamine--glycine ligase